MNRKCDEGKLHIDRCQCISKPTDRTKIWSKDIFFVVIFNCKINSKINSGTTNRETNVQNEHIIQTTKTIDE